MEAGSWVACQSLMAWARTSGAATEGRQRLCRGEAKLPQHRIHVRQACGAVHLLPEELDEHPALGVGRGRRYGGLRDCRGRGASGGNNRAVGVDVLGDHRHGHWHVRLVRLLLLVRLRVLG